MRPNSATASGRATNSSHSYLSPSSSVGGVRDRRQHPSLFLHPSPQASHVSIPGPGAANEGGGGGMLGSSAGGGAGTTAATATTMPTIAATRSSRKVKPLLPNGHTQSSTTHLAATIPTITATSASTTSGFSSTPMGTSLLAAAAPLVTTSNSSGGMNLQPHTYYTVASPSSLNFTGATSFGAAGTSGVMPASAHGARSRDRTDVLWAEMQATLEEVEFSATQSTRVFRPEHEARLEELRTAQIALAEAWARSEADDEAGIHNNNYSHYHDNSFLGATETSATSSSSLVGAPVGGAAATGVGGANVGGAGRAVSTTATGAAGSTTAGARRSKDGAAAAAASGEIRNLNGDADNAAGVDSAAAGDASFPRGATAGNVAAAERMGRMEAETEIDMALAKKRREANDRYFKAVNQGVIDVVAKLSDVAEAMRRVEAESKDIWGDR